MPNPPPPMTLTSRPLPSSGASMDPVTVGLMAASTAGNLYSGKQQAKSSQASSDQQAQANRAQLAYMAQKDYEAQLAAEAAQRSNYDMWRSGQELDYNRWRANQQTSNDLLQAREQRLGALGQLIGAPARAAIRTEIPGYTIPDYVPGPLPTRPAGGSTLRDYLNK